MSSQKSKPFALPDTLHDLALLRSSGIDLSAVVPDDDAGHTHDPAMLESSARSREFVAETRAALSAYNGGELQRKNLEVLKVQRELQEVVVGLTS